MSNDELMIDLNNLENDELLAFKEHIEQKYAEICENCIMEYTKLMQDENFDQYSFFGKREINKILDKQQDAEDGFKALMQEVLKEIKQRQLTIEDVEMDSEFEGFKTMTDEEFIKLQMQKSEEFKSKK